MFIHLNKKYNKINILKRNQTYKKIYYPLNDIQPTRNLAAGDGDQWGRGGPSGAGKNIPPPPSPQEFQRVEADMGRQLTEEENKFVDAQLEKNRILAIQSAKRSAEQSTRLKKLKNFIEHARKKLQDPRLIIEKPPAKTPAQRKATPAISAFLGIMLFLNP